MYFSIDKTSFFIETWKSYSLYGLIPNNLVRGMRRSPHVTVQQNADKSSVKTVILLCSYSYVFVCQQWRLRNLSWEPYWLVCIAPTYFRQYVKGVASCAHTICIYYLQGLLYGRTHIYFCWTLIGVTQKQYLRKINMRGWQILTVYHNTICL